MCGLYWGSWILETSKCTDPPATAGAEVLPLQPCERGSRPWDLRCAVRPGASKSLLGEEYSHPWVDRLWNT